MLVVADEAPSVEAPVLAGAQPVIEGDTREVTVDAGDDVAVQLPRRTELAVDPDCDPGRLSLMDRGKEWLKRWTR